MTSPSIFSSSRASASADRALGRCLLLGSVLLASPALRAQPITGPCDTTPKCKVLFQQAEAWTEAKDDEKALLLYRSILYEFRDMRALYPIGTTLLRLGRADEAVRTCEHLLKSGVAKAPEEIRAVEDLLSQAEEAVRRAAPSGPAQAPPIEPALPQSSQAPSRMLPPPPVTTEAKVPLYKRWWLWTSVGLGTAGAVVGITLGIMARRPYWPDAPRYQPFQ